MIRVALYNPNTELVEIGGEEFIDTWNNNQDLVIWADFDAVDREKERKYLLEIFNLDELAVDDAQRDRHPPKLEIFDNYFFLLLKAFNARTDSIDFGILHISLFVGRNFFVTRHPEISPSINYAWDLMNEKNTLFKKGPIHLCYRVIRRIIERKTPIIIEMEKHLEKYEEEMIERPSDKLLIKLIHYNSNLKKLKRIFKYQEAILAEMISRNTGILDKQSRHEFQDLHEQMERLSSLSALLQELIKDLVDGYISISSHRLNNIMKVLTIVAVFFLPLTFIAGIYGMNFEYMPELGFRHAYFVVLGVMTMIATIMYFAFRKIQWI
jgi:magnesium transporter